MQTTPNSQLPTPTRSRGRSFGRWELLVGSFVATLSVLGIAAQSSIVDAARGGDAAAVRALLARKADANATAADGTTALHWAAWRDDVAMVEALVRAGAKVGATTRLGVTPLQLAATNGS